MHLYKRTCIFPIHPVIARVITEYTYLKYVCVCVCVRALYVTCYVRLLVTLWTIAHQIPLSVGFFRQEYWRGLPCPLPGDILDPEIEPTMSHVYCIGRWVLYH